MKVKVSLTFWIILSLMIAINGFEIYFLAILSSVFHEIGHLILLKTSNIRISQLKISAVGGKIYATNIDNLSNLNQLLIYSFGIIFNLILAFISQKIAINGFHSRQFFMLCGINLVLCFFNLLPIFSLDGYNILHCLLSFVLNPSKTQVICKNISLFFNFLLLLCGIYLSFKFNFSILIISIYLLIIFSKNIVNLSKI